jgi:hypothetical protein
VHLAGRNLVQQRAQAFGLFGHAVAGLRVAPGLAEAGQVGTDHAVVRREEARDAGKVVLVAGKAVHQHQGVAFAAFQVRHAEARHAGLAQAQAGAQPLQRDADARGRHRRQAVEQDQRHQQGGAQRQQGADEVDELLWVHYRVSLLFESLQEHQA